MVDLDLQYVTCINMYLQNGNPHQRALHSIAEVERLSIFTNQRARNQEFGFSNLHTKAKVPRLSQLKCLLFDKGDGLSKEDWVGQEWKPKPWSRGRPILSLKNQSLTRSWPLDWIGCFGQRITWTLGLAVRVIMTVRVEMPWEFMAKDFELWAWSLEASHYARPKAPFIIFY